MNDLFDRIEELEKVPTSLLKEVTVTPAPDITDLLSHTAQTNPLQGFAQATPLNGQGAPVMTPNGQFSGNMPQQGQQLSVGSLMTADMSAGFVNILIPAAIVIIIERTTKKRVVKSQFEATPKELEIIKPVLQKYLESVNFRIDTPFNALVITLAFIYGSKTVEALNGQAKGTIKTGSFKAPNIDGMTTPQPAEPAKKTRKRSIDKRVGAHHKKIA